MQLASRSSRRWEGRSWRNPFLYRYRPNMGKSPNAFREFGWVVRQVIGRTMAHPPYMNSTGLISKIFDKIAEAQKPERFTTDYLGSVLGYSSGSARPIIPLLKRLNFLQADGTPTQLYTRFRNPSERGPA